MRSLATRSGLVVGLILLAETVAFAAGYATDDQGNLYRVFPLTKEVERIARVEVPGEKGPEIPALTDIALSPKKGMYGISYTMLYKIDMRDPKRSKRIGKLGPPLMNALEFDGDGNLWAAGGGAFYRVDLETGKATKVGDLGTGRTSDGDLAWAADIMYATADGKQGCELLRLDLKTGKATSQGTIQDAKKKVVRDVWGLIWDGRVLWVLTPAGEILAVDRKSAVVKPRFRAKVRFWGSCAMIRI